MLEADGDSAEEVHQVLALFIPISLPSISHGPLLAMGPPVGQSPVPRFSKPHCLACSIYFLLAEREQSHPKAVPRNRKWRHLSGSRAKVHSKGLLSFVVTSLLPPKSSKSLPGCFLTYRRPIPALSLLPDVSRVIWGRQRWSHSPMAYQGSHPHIGALSASLMQLCVASHPLFVHPAGSSHHCKNKSHFSVLLFSSPYLCLLPMYDGTEGTVCFCYL